jgi:sigma-B regulation protein RsbU (phosphoserine phosphatase)
METQTIRRSGLSAFDPSTACIDVSVERRSARRDQLRGGDLADVYHDADGSVWLLLADVSSKGARSIAHVELLQAAFRRAVRGARSPSRVVAALNRLRFESADDRSDAFATAFVACLGRASRSLCYASGGHDTALVLCGSTHRHLVPTGPVIGVIPNAAYGDCSVPFGSKDILVVATDGFTECRRARAPFEQLGTSGFVRALRAEAARSARAVCTIVGAFADAFTEGEYRDDATLVVVARR